MPWYKLGVKFGRTSIIKKFLAKWSNRDLFQSTAGRRGTAGDKIELIKMDEHNVTVNDIFRLYTIDKDDAQVMER